jgi:muconolactone delta-isomerase
MKFFVTAKIRTGARVSSRTLEAHNEYLRASLADGSIDCIYAFVGGGGFSISNADSPEQMQERLAQSPLFPFVEWEVHALIDYNRALDGAVEGAKKQGL